MAVYNILLVLMLGLGYLLCVWKPSRIKKIIYIVIIFGYMWCLATFRNGIGFDYDSYIAFFNETIGISLKELLATKRFEPGYMIFVWLIGKITTSTVVMYGIHSAVILIPIAVFVYRHCEDAWLSAWLYMTMAFLYTNMSFMRQSIACSIGVFAFGFFKEKLSVKNALAVIGISLLAASFHKTALVIIVVYFVSRIPLTLVTGSIYALGALAAFVSSRQIVNLVTNYVFEGYKDSKYVNRVLGYQFLLIPVIIVIVCAALYIPWRKEDPSAPVMLNVAIITATIWIFGSLRHMILERFCMYTYVFSIAILPSALRSLKLSTKDSLALEAQEVRVAGFSNPPKSESAKLKSLQEKETDHRYYYISAVVAILLLTFLYNYFGMYQNGFHNVFPFVSVFSKG